MVEECELLLAALLPPGFDSSLMGPMAQSMMAGELSRWGALGVRQESDGQNAVGDRLGACT
jgi:hypothetical protein